MSNNPPIPPALTSIPRIRTLVASLLVCLGSGTNYVSNSSLDCFLCRYESKKMMLLGLFRWGAPSFVIAAGDRNHENDLLTILLCIAYSPQLGARLKISHTQLNIVAFAGNGAEFRAIQQPTWHFSVGVYSFGPIWGRIVDSHGPRIPLACSFVCLLVGYSGIRYLYDSGLAPDVLSASAIIFYALLLCSFLIGVGSTGGSTSAIYSTAKTFPDRAVCIYWRFCKVYLILITRCQRASTTGLVISGYGLSAFLFSTISHIFFAGSVSPLLLVLSLGSSFPMILGFFFVRPIPLPEEELNREVYSETSPSACEQRNSSSYTPLLDLHINGQDDDDDDARIGVEPNPSLRSQNCETSRSLSSGAAMAPDMLPNVYGMKLWCSIEFWLLCCILTIRTFPYLFTISSLTSCL